MRTQELPVPGAVACAGAGGGEVPGAVPAAGPVAVTGIFTKDDLSRWTRAHEDPPGINWTCDRPDEPGLSWTVHPGPGGTMVITEYACDRRDLPAPVPAVRAAGGSSGPSRPAAGPVRAWCAAPDALPARRPGRAGDGS